MNTPITRSPRYDSAFLRLMVGVLFYPCFLLMIKKLPLQSYLIAGLFLLYATLLFTFPRLNHRLAKTFPIPIVLDVLLTTLFIYYTGSLATSLALLYFFPLISSVSYNKVNFSLSILSLISVLYILVAFLLKLAPIFVAIQILLFFVGSFYVWHMSQHFHQSYYKQANQDTLTKISNRRFFNHSMEQLIKAQTPYSLIMVDLDNFKLLNDTQGHHHGDYVLKIVATLIKECIRSYDIVARYGGDEFTIILPYSSKEEAKNTAERIRNSVMVSPKLLPYSFISISQGISAYPEDATSLDGILEKADEALYRAKNMGKNCIHLSSSNLT